MRYGVPFARQWVRFANWGKRSGAQSLLLYEEGVWSVNTRITVPIFGRLSFEDRAGFLAMRRSAGKKRRVDPISSSTMYNLWSGCEVIPFAKGTETWLIY